MRELHGERRRVSCRVMRITYRPVLCQKTQELKIHKAQKGKGATTGKGIGVNFCNKNS